MTGRRASLALFTLLALVCSGTTAFAAGAAPHWSYEGHGGPAHWAALEPEFASCKIGHAQSPIDIRTKAIKGEALPAIEFAYKPGAAKIVDNGHTIQVVPAPGDAITIGGHRYELVQFHFHKPSEEKVDGKSFDMVAHLVHQSADGKLAVVAVLLAEGGANASLGPVFDSLPQHEGDKKALSAGFNASGLLPGTRSYYKFMGSLTTPPCSEGVHWQVMKQPVEVSAAQIAAFREWERPNGARFADLKGIQQPTLVLNGIHDEMIPVSNSYRLVENLPNAVLLAYPDSGHGSLFQYHQAFTRQASAFLASDSSVAPY